MNIDFDLLEKEVRARFELGLAAVATLREVFQPGGMRGPGVTTADVLRQVVAAADEKPKPKTGRTTSPRPSPPSDGGEGVERRCGGSVQELARAWIEKQPVNATFATRDIAAVCRGVRRSSLATVLYRWTALGMLEAVGRVVGRGSGKTFRRGANWGARAADLGPKIPAPGPVVETVADYVAKRDAVEMPKLAGIPASPQPELREGGDSMKGKRGERRQLMLGIARGWGSKQWLASSMIEELQRLAPHTVDCDQKQQAARVELVELQGTGELKSIGTGSVRYYTTAGGGSIGGRLAIDQEEAS